MTPRHITTAIETLAAVGAVRPDVRPVTWWAWLLRIWRMR